MAYALVFSLGIAALRRIRTSLTKAEPSSLRATTPRLCDITSVTRRAPASENFGTASVASRPSSIAACTAAPRATTSSTFTPALGSRPDICLTNWRTIGIRVDPPTSSTPAIRDQSRPASAIASSVSRRVRSMRGNVIASNSARASSYDLRTVPIWSVIRAVVLLGEGPLQPPRPAAGLR